MKSFSDDSETNDGFDDVNKGRLISLGSGGTNHSKHSQALPAVSSPPAKMAKRKDHQFCSYCPHCIQSRALDTATFREPPLPWIIQDEKQVGDLKYPHINLDRYDEEALHENNADLPDRHEYLPGVVIPTRENVLKDLPTFYRAPMFTSGPSRYHSIRTPY